MQPKWMGKSNKAVAIARISSRAQEGNTSHETQEEHIRKYCEFNGLELVKVFKFVESAKNSEGRKQYAAAGDWADSKRIRHRLFFMQDREARNLTDVEHSEERVKADEIVLHYVNERKIVWFDSPDHDFLMRDFNAVQNKHFSRLIGAKVKSAAITKAEGGWFPGNHAPLGYAHERLLNDNGVARKRGTIIVPNPDHRKVEQVRREFELRGDERKTLTQIKEQLVEEGFITRKQARNYESTLERRLKNPFYAGKFDWKGQTYEGRHELIIDPDLFETVQTTFGNKGLYAKKRGDFSGGWLRCGECGCAVTYDPKQKKLADGSIRQYGFYRCSNGKKIHKSLKGAYVSETKIWNGLGSAVEEITITEGFAEMVAEALNKTRRKAHDARKRQVEGYQKALDELESGEDTLYDRLDRGVIDEQGFKRQLGKVREERRRMTQLLDKASGEITDAVYETAQSIIELATNAKGLWLQRSAAEKRDFLEKLLSNRVLDGQSVRYDLRKPFRVLAEMKQKEEWRPLVEYFITACAA